MGRDEFKNHVRDVATRFQQTSAPVKLVSNLDADGISAAAIASKALTRAGYQHSTRIVHQLGEDNLASLHDEGYGTYVFTDVGSGDLELINTIFDDCTVVILDHHHPKGEAESAWHVNPHLFDVDGSAEISAAGVSFLFARALSEVNEDLAHLAIVGAIGDVQEDDGFHGLNAEILDIGTGAGVVDVVEGLNLYGKQSRPLYKLLEYSTDLHIPGVTNNASGAIQFLQSLDIDPKRGNQWRYLDDLTSGEREQLVAGLAMRCDATVDDVLTPVYTIPHRDGIFSNAREFSTLLNACGRLDKASIGLGACLEKDGFESKALQVRKEYTSEIVSALDWFESAGEEYVTRGDGYVVINAEDNVLNTIIGTVISILAKSGEYDEGTFFLSLARKPEGVTKVSIRVVGNPEDVNLKEIIGDLADHVGGESGGHQFAAGALIDTECEEEFVANAVSYFEEL